MAYEKKTFTTPFEPKPNTGAFFKNGFKERDNHPDYKGDVYLEKGLLDLLVREHTNNAGLVRISLSGWKAQTKEGQTYLSIKASEPYVPAGAKKPAARQDEDISQDDEDVPF